VAHQQVQVPRIRKPKLLRSNPTRSALIRYSEYDPVDIPFDDEDILTGYFARKNQLDVIRNSKDLEDDNNDLSDYVLARLAQAREKAVEMARSKTSTT